MAQLVGNTEIRFIEGDDFERKLEFPLDVASEIASVTFSCGALNVCKALDRQGNYFVLRLVNAETALYSSGHFTYDITLKFKSGEVLSQTGITINIVNKENKC